MQQVTSRSFATRISPNKNKRTKQKKRWKLLFSMKNETWADTWKGGADGTSIKNTTHTADKGRRYPLNIKLTICCTPGCLYPYKPTPTTQHPHVGCACTALHWNDLCVPYANLKGHFERKPFKFNCRVSDHQCANRAGFMPWKRTRGGQGQRVANCNFDWNMFMLLPKPLYYALLLGFHAKEDTESIKWW